MNTKLIILSLVAIAAIPLGVFVFTSEFGQTLEIKTVTEESDVQTISVEPIYDSAISSEPITGDNFLTDSSITVPRFMNDSALQLSKLPKIGETAQISATFSHNYFMDTPSGYKKIFQISDNFEFVNSTLPVTQREGFDGYFIEKSLEILNSNQTATFSATVKAIGEGKGFIIAAAWDGGERIDLMVGSEETVLFAEYLSANPSSSEDSSVELDVSAEVPSKPYTDTDDFVFEDQPESVIREELEDMGYSSEEIDEIISEITLSKTQSTDESVSVQNSSSFSTSGRITNTPADYDPSTSQFVYGLKVCAVDKTGSTNTYTNLNNISGTEACSITSKSGIYFIRNIVNDDPDDDTGVDLYLQYYSEGNYVNVKDESNNLYSAVHFLQNNLSSSTTSLTGQDHNLNVYTKFNRAAWIVDTLHDAREYFDDQSKNISSVNVKWQHDEKLSTVNNSPCSGACYQRSTNTIWFDGTTNTIIPPPKGDEHNTWVQLHEYGHHIMRDQLGLVGWGQACTDNGSGHIHYMTNTAACAMSEGWADFIPHLVRDVEKYQYSSNIWFDLERDAVYNGDSGQTRNMALQWPTTDSEGNHVGHLTEGQVASMLWDIYDTNQDAIYDSNKDTVDTTSSTMINGISRLDTVATSNHKIVAKDYYDKWNSVSLDDVASIHYMGFIAPMTNPTPTTAIFSDNFEGTFSKWTLSSDDDDDWEINTVQRPGALSNNKVAHSSNCDKNCYMVSDTINTSGTNTELIFYRYIATSIDNNEGLKVQVSTNNGISWTQLVFLSSNNDSDDSTWREETIDLSSYQSSQLKIRFNAVSSSSSEHVRIDDVIITPKGITTASIVSFNENFDNLNSWTKSGDDMWTAVSTWNEDNPTTVSTNKFATAKNCDDACTLTLTNFIDISSLNSANLEISRFVDRSLDNAEYLGIDVYDGTTWRNVATWSDNNNEDTDEWETETINISSYLDDQFKIRINAQMSSTSEDVGIDYIQITTG